MYISLNCTITNTKYYREIIQSSSTIMFSTLHDLHMVFCDLRIQTDIKSRWGSRFGPTAITTQNCMLQRHNRAKYSSFRQSDVCGVFLKTRNSKTNQAMTGCLVPMAFSPTKHVCHLSLQGTLPSLSNNDAKGNWSPVCRRPRASPGS